jgi:peptidoglycan/LPS O-acetylase OafA/YrhL
MAPSFTCNCRLLGICVSLRLENVFGNGHLMNMATHPRDLMLSRQSGSRHRYRPDIDGLRALAILPVVFFHAHLGMPGGFVGVDIFFVISGFLITTLIAEEISDRQFSLVGFYDRRVRRIFPALFVVLLLTVFVAYLSFMPPEFMLVGRSAIATALFYSNMQFWREAGYFDAVADLKPLLHTWSLAVEEQFYIVFPFLLIAIEKWYPRRRLTILVAVLAISFLLSVWWVHRQPVDAFFLMPARFWELGVGAVIALADVHGAEYPRLSRMPSSRLATGMGLVGLVMIAIAVFALSEHMPFPGMTALLPCIGAALVIIAGKVRNSVSALLAARPLVFIGLISYSLYLWHWPLIVFVQYQTGHLLTATQAWLVIAVSILAAIASWWLIERPVRQRRFLRGRAGLFRLAFAMMALSCAAGAAIVVGRGLPDRLPPNVRAIYATKSVNNPFRGSKCLTKNDGSGPTDDDVRNGRLCSVGIESRTEQVDFLVWGDSHAGAMAPGIDKAAKLQQRSGLLAADAGCPPLLDYESQKSDADNQEDCHAHNEAVVDFIRSRHIQLVFLIGRWPREVLGSQLGNEGPFYDPKESYKIRDRSAIVSEALDKTLATLAAMKTRVVLVMDVPEIGFDVPYELAKAALRKTAVDIAPSWEALDARQHVARAILQAAAAKYGAEIIDPVGDFCPQQRCAVADSDGPYYTDSNHLSVSGANHLMHLYEPVLRQQGASLQ